MFVINQIVKDHNLIIKSSCRNNTYKLKYAYYVYLNNEVIEKKMYTYDNVFKFDFSGLAGTLKIRCFFKNIETNVIEHFDSDIVKLERKIVDLKDLNLSNDFDHDVLVGNERISAKYVKKQKSRKLFVFLNGAVSLKVQESYNQYFSRVSWSDKFDGDCLYLYDESLNLVDNYTIGWYRGTTERPLHNKYIDLIKHAAHTLNLKNSEIVFYGSSAGGFAALKFSESIVGSTAVAINPQYKITDYNILIAVNNFKNVFDVQGSMQDTVVDLRKFKKNASKMIIVQNIQDKHHYELHFSKLWQQLSSKKSGWDSSYNNYALLYDHESGHGGEPAEVFEEIMKLIS